MKKRNFAVNTPRPSFDMDIVKQTWERFELYKGVRPLVACLIVGGVLTFAAMHTGVPELAIGLAAGYTTYRMMRFGLSLPEVLREGAFVRQ